MMQKNNHGQINLKKSNNALNVAENRTNKVLEQVAVNQQEQTEETKKAALNIHDEKKMKAMIKLLTTLEDKSTNEYGDSPEQDSSEQNNYNDEGSTPHSGQAEAGGDEQQQAPTTRNILMTLERTFVKKLCQINYLLLTYNMVSVSAYQLIHLLEFLQLLFYIFYAVPVADEFKPAVANFPPLSLSATDELSFFESSDGLGRNLEVLQQNIDESNQNVTYDVKRYHIDESLIFINFQFYTVGSSSYIGFLILYGSFITAFYGYVIIIWLSSGPLFNTLKKDSLKQATKWVLKCFSLIMTLMLTLMQLPFSTLMLQGFLCEEDPEQDYTLPEITCDSYLHKILLVLSIVSLLSYYSFLWIQLQLFTSCSFVKDVPWSQFDRKNSLVHMLIRFILSLAIIFNKAAGPIQSYILIGCSMVLIYPLAKRLTEAIFFIKSVHYAVVIYEVLEFGLMLAVGVHSLVHEGVTITNLVFFLLLMFLLAVIFILLQNKSQEMLLMNHQAKKLSSPRMFEQYFFNLYNTIKSNTRSDQTILRGLIRDHLDTCKSERCECGNLTKDLDYMKSQLKLKQEYEYGAANSSGGVGQEASEYQAMSSSQNLNVLPQSYMQRMESNSMIIASRVESFRNLLPSVSPQDRPFLSQFISEMGSSKKNEEEKIERYIQGLDDLLGPIVEGTIEEERRLLLIEEGNQKKYYKFMSHQLATAIHRFPKSVELRLINSFIQKQHLNNPYRAVFEIMNCEQGQPTLSQKLHMFKGKREIEQFLLIQHAKISQKNGYLDVKDVFQYEKTFQRFQLNEYLAVNSALSFWKELVSKDLNSTAVQQRGMEISRFYIKIQDAVKEMQKLYPNDIKFLYRYGRFLVNIINNEFEGLECFQRASQIYSSKVLKKGSNLVKNEDSTFGENTGAAVVIVEATSQNIGRIIHSNDELEHLLGYSRKEVIYKNIKMITPSLIARDHDRYIRKYLETGKQKLLEKQRQLFAVNKEGYLVPIEIIIKIHPSVEGRLLLVGLMQKTKEYTEMDPVKNEYQGLDEHYIMTDSQGYISNISDGLCLEMGMHSKFFRYSNSDFTQMVNMRILCQSIMDPDVISSLEFDQGMNLTFDTAELIQNADLEQFSSEEAWEIKSSAGKYQVSVQMMKLMMGDTKNTALLFRILMINGIRGNANEQSDMTQGQKILSGTNTKQHIRNSDMNSDQLSELQREGTGTNNDQMSFGQPSQMSYSSTASSTNRSFDGIIKNFKQTLGDRKTPFNLTVLNRLIISVMLLLIMLQIVDFSILRNDVGGVTGENIHILTSSRRILSVAQIASNVRSYINVANKLEYSKFQAIDLNRYFDRYEFLGRLIQFQQEELQEIQEMLSKERVDDDSGTNVLQSRFEYKPIKLLRLDDQNQVTTYYQPFRTTMFTFINGILSLNNTEETELLELPENLLRVEPLGNSTVNFDKTTLLQKQAYFLMINGLRSLRTRSVEATEFQQITSFSNVSSSPYLTVMIIGIILTIVSMIAIILQMFQIERIQANILSLLALLQVNHILQVYNKCNDYINELNEGSFIKQIADKNRNIKESDFVMGSVDVNSGETNEIGLGESIRNIGFQPPSNLDMDISIMRNNQNTSPPHRRQSLVSEEEKEEYLYSMKREQNKMLSQAGRRPFSREVRRKEFSFIGTGENLYASIIKRTLQEINSTSQEFKTSSSTFQNEKLLPSQSKNGNPPISNQNKPQNTKIKRRFGVKQDASDQQKAQDNSDERSFEEIKEEEENDEDSKSELREEDIQFGTRRRKSDKAINQREKHHYKKSKHKKKKDKGKEHSDLMPSEEHGPGENNLEQRKQQFAKTLKTAGLNKKIASVILCLFLCSYFIQLQLFHEYYQGEIHELLRLIPLFLDRFRFLILTFTFLRERILYNNSLQSFEEEPNFGHNLDQYYYEKSISNEQQILYLIAHHPEISADLVDFFDTMNSPKFCTEIIGQSKSKEIASLSKIKKINMKTIPLSEIREFQNLITTVIRACKAAFLGDVSILAVLQSKGVDLSQGDYDYRTPLHFAVRGNRTEAVKFLIDVARVNINLRDRWESTPINYAQPNTEIYDVLIRNGAIKGERPIFFYPQHGFTLNENEARMYYSAFYNDVITAEAMYNFGVKFDSRDIDARSPIHIAAAMGNYDVLKFMAFHQADLTFIDSRGHNAMDEAENNGYIVLHNFIDGIISDKMIKEYCSSFAQGLLNKGLLQAFGTFHKKFSDYNLRVQAASNYEERLTILRGEQFRDVKEDYETYDEEFIRNFNFNTLQIYQQTQELYISRVINVIIDQITNTFSDFTDQYSQYTLIVFLIFFSFQMFTLIVLRRAMMSRMRADIFESRGILNLIPDHIIEQNKVAVESIIKKLKD